MSSGPESEPNVRQRDEDDADVDVKPEQSFLDDEAHQSDEGDGGDVDSSEEEDDDDDEEEIARVCLF